MITVEMHGGCGFFRNPLESGTQYSSPGPAPSAIAGFAGIALGFRSQSAGPQAGPIPWPVAADLLEWLRKTNCRVAAAWIGGSPTIQRRSHNVNAIKDAFRGNPGECFVRQEQVLVWKPSYLIAFDAGEAEEELERALREPYWRPYFGSRNSPAWFTAVSRTPRAARWARICKDPQDGTPITQTVINAQEAGERLVLRDTFWDYSVLRVEPSLPDERHFVAAGAILPAKA